MMTFILTELSKDCIIMTADSAEIEFGTFRIKPIDKVIHYYKLNIGVSTWGIATIKGEDINSWLQNSKSQFHSDVIKGQLVPNKYLRQLAEYLGHKLNTDIPNGESNLGLHVAGYMEIEGILRPVVYHVHNHNPDEGLEIESCKSHNHKNAMSFVAEENIYDETEPDFHLRNGIYKEFAAYYPEFEKSYIKFLERIKANHSSLVLPSRDMIRVRAEYAANLVNLVRTAFTLSGLYPVVGMAIKVIAIEPHRVQRFVLPEFNNQ